MAAPGIPQNFYVTQGNGQVFLQWDLCAGATSYDVQRSTDGVTYASIATPAVNQYLDANPTIGTFYYYKVASVNGSDTSGYSEALTIVPTMGGEMSLSEIDIRSRQRADRLNSKFVGTAENISNINQSLYELYDLLIDVYEDYYKAPDALFYSSGGNQQAYPMPNGILTFKDNSGNDFVAAPIYKLLGLDMGLNVSNNGWVTVSKYNYIDRNRFFYPNTASTIYGVFNCQYRWLGDKIEFIPVPSGNQPFRILYIPRLPALLQPSDLTTSSVSGWIEYVITDVAIKILQKEESDVSQLVMQKEALRQRIMSGAANRDAGMPDTISSVRGNGWWGGSNGPSGWNHGGF